MADKNFLEKLILISVSTTVISLIIAFASNSYNRKEELNSFKAEAVKRGYAEWTTGENNQPEFKWKETKPEKGE